MSRTRRTKAEQVKPSCAKSLGSTNALDGRSTSKRSVRRYGCVRRHESGRNFMTEMKRARFSTSRCRYLPLRMPLR